MQIPRLAARVRIDATGRRMDERIIHCVGRYARYGEPGLNQLLGKCFSAAHRRARMQQNILAPLREPRA